MDPIGFALENYDAVGRWRDSEMGLPIDTTGQMLGGKQFSGIRELEETLLKRPELFASTLSERLLMFAIGRSLNSSDAPAIRKIVNEARMQEDFGNHSASQGYRFSSLIVGITKSIPFLMRTSE